MVSGHSRARAVPDIAKELPETLKSTISRKIDQLNESDRRLMQVASVQGYAFDAAVLSDVLGLDAADTEDRLAEIEKGTGLIRQVETREFPDRTLTVRYRFVHVLYQNVLFGGLQPTRRNSTSLKVAQALETHYRDQASSIAAELAVLFETGRDFAKAAQYFLAATAKSVPLFAYREAVLLASRGLEMVKLLAEGPSRLQLELGLLMYLGLCQRTLQGWAAAQVEGIYLRAREIVLTSSGTRPSCFRRCGASRSFTRFAATSRASRVWPKNCSNKPPPAGATNS